MTVESVIVNVSAPIPPLLKPTFSIDDAVIDRYVVAQGAGYHCAGDLDALEREVEARPRSAALPRRENHPEYRYTDRRVAGDGHHRDAAAGDRATVDDQVLLRFEGIAAKTRREPIRQDDVRDSRRKHDRVHADAACGTAIDCRVGVRGDERVLYRALAGDAAGTRIVDGDGIGQQYRADRCDHHSGDAPARTPNRSARHRSLDWTAIDALPRLALNAWGAWITRSLISFFQSKRNPGPDPDIAPKSRVATIPARRFYVGEFTRLINEGADADGVPVDALWSAAYAELKVLAHSRLYRDGQSTLLDTTSLVNESYVKLAGNKTLRIDDRRGFFAYASRVMRSVIVDLVRERMSQRRGGDAEHLGLTMTIADPGPTTNRCASMKHCASWERSSPGSRRLSRCATSEVSRTRRSRNPRRDRAHRRARLGQSAPAAAGMLGP